MAITFIMLPLSIYLTSRATKDRGLFDLDSILEPIKRILSPKEDPLLTLEPLPVQSEVYQNLRNQSDKKLIDIIKNYRQYDLSVSHKNSALQI